MDIALLSFLEFVCGNMDPAGKDNGPKLFEDESWVDSIGDLRILAKNESESGDCGVVPNSAG